MTKQHILDEIRGPNKANGGVPLGKKVFFRETGIKESDWYGKYWSRWGDACIEAGFAPNKRTESYGKEVLVERCIALIRELRKMPVVGELRLKRRNDPSFPGTRSLFKNLGTMKQIRAKVLDYCHNHPGFEDVLGYLTESVSVEHVVPHEKPKAVEIGCVYLLKSGRRFKIGRTNAIGRREYELGTKLPDESRTSRARST